jgi:hypothetical protein
MKPDRSFYTATGALFLVLTVLGFQRYIFGGKHFDGSPIETPMLATVVAHSSSVFAWYVLFFVQSLLISTQNRRLHMKLGWSVLVVASVIAVTGLLVAIRSTRSATFGAVVFDWPGPQFLLIMFTEIALFVTFVAIGVLNRKRPRVHRPMMVLASLAILSGATGRIAWVNSIFGFHTWAALFGPVAALGALLLLVRFLMTRRLEREFAFGFATFVLATVVAARVAATNVWLNWAGAILKF